MWEQVCFKVDNQDLINNVGTKNDFHWGIKSSELMAQKDNFIGGKLLIGICGCTCEGCDDIIVTVGNLNKNIYWDVHHEVGGCPVKVEHEYFMFNKDKYISKLHELEKIITR
ncbi:MAG: hypothetical protein Ta2B_16870 [Termitinemataceae bacterium]|nr:MAG: hypothetical protein Ta2B_16870 [Termitinemataceae bacterium]